MRIELYPEEKRIVESYADRMGMTQISVMSRLAGWFSCQHEEVQALVMDLLPATITQDAAALALRNLLARSKEAAK